MIPLTSQLFLYYKNHAHHRYQNYAHIQCCFCSVIYNQYWFSTFHVALDPLESKKNNFYILRILFARFGATMVFRSDNCCYTLSWYWLNLQCNPPNSVPSLRTDVFTKKIFVYKSLNYYHLSETIAGMSIRHYFTRKKIRISQ